LHVLRLHRIDTGILAIVMGLSVIGQIGDLSESMLKRSYGVKDSSRILPGHGGILDRVDGLLFAIPVFYMYLRFKI
jgi:phosphatidate cytidylyltransferase